MSCLRKLIKKLVFFLLMALFYARYCVSLKLRMKAKTLKAPFFVLFWIDLNKKNNQKMSCMPLVAAQNPLSSAVANPPTPWGKSARGLPI
jgi:hypothetical protein